MLRLISPLLPLLREVPNGQKLPTDSLMETPFFLFLQIGMHDNSQIILPNNHPAIGASLLIILTSIILTFAHQPPFRAVGLGDVPTDVTSKPFFCPFIFLSWL